MLIKNFKPFKIFTVFFFLLYIVQFIKCDTESINNIDKIKISNEQKIKVSIIIPVYNTSKFIERCLKSALNQTLKEIEVIVIDDHSTDNSLEIIRKFEKDKRLKIVSLNQNQGPGLARNLGMELAVGEFIGFIDSDDYADLRFYEFLYKYSNNNDKVNGIFVNSTNLSNKYSHHRKYYAYGATCDSIWRREFINKYHIRYPIGHKNGEDIAFRKLFKSKNPREVQTPDEGIYYYYKRREGSRMNYEKDYIERLNKINTIEEKILKSQ